MDAGETDQKRAALSEADLRLPNGTRPGGEGGRSLVKRRHLLIKPLALGIQCREDDIVYKVEEEGGRDGNDELPGERRMVRE